MPKAIATHRESRARCIKGHLQPRIVLAEGESREQSCKKCDDKITTAVTRNSNGELRVTVQHSSVI